MRFYKNQHQFYAGVDLHARQMFVCIIDSDGNTLFHKNMVSGNLFLGRNFNNLRREDVG